MPARGAAAAAACAPQAELAAALDGATLTWRGWDSARRAGGSSLRRWTREDGLPQDTVTAIEKTRDGYLWIGTFGGLARFDGVSFDVRTLNESPGLSSNRIMALEETRDGCLWIATEAHGVVRLRAGEFAPYPESQVVGEPRALLEDASGALWIAGVQGLGRIRDGRFELVLDFQCNDLALDPQGKVWVATALGVQPAAGPTQQAAHHADPFVYDGVAHQLAFDSVGRLWLFRADGVARASASPPDGMFEQLAADMPRRLWSTFEDAAGRMLLGGEHGFSAFEFAPEREDRDAAPRPVEHGLTATGGVRVFFADDDENLWIGTNGAGLWRITPTSYRVLGPEAGVPETVSEVAATSNGIWMARSRAELLRWEGDGIVPVAIESAEIAHERPEFGIIGTTSDETLWLYEGERVLRYGPHGRATVCLEVPGLVGGVAGDGPERAWFGGLDALVGYVDGVTQLHALPEIGRVRPAYIDGSGAPWFLFDGGIGRWLPDGPELFRMPQRVGGTWRALARDARGTCWITSYGGGLIRFRDGRFAHLGEEQGLEELSFGGILVHDEHLWINSNSGVVRLSIADADAVADGHVPQVHGRLFQTGEGNGPTAALSADGHLWFPTVDGIAVLDPRLGTPDLTPPRPRIVSLSAERVAVPLEALDGSSVAGSASGSAPKLAARLAPGSDDLEITYTGLCFTAPEQVRFRYRLAGYEDDWVLAGKRRTAYFTHVPPGRYVFEVEAGNADGVWTRTPAQLVVELEPHLFQTLWLRVLSVGLLIALGVSFFVARIRIVERHNAALQREIVERERVEAERRQLEEALREAKRLESIGRLAGGVAHDFNNVLTVILSRAELLEQADAIVRDPELADHVRSLRDCGSRASGLVKQLLAFSRRQFLQPRVLDPNECVRRLEPMLRHLMPEGVAMELVLDPGVGHVRVDPSQFEQVVMNLALNARDAMPHGGALSIETHAVERAQTDVVPHAGARSGTHAQLTVRDTGQGIPTDVLPHVFEPFFSTKDEGTGSTGLGLASVHGIVMQSGGNVTVESTPGQGATFRVFLPSVADESQAAAELAAEERAAAAALVGTETVLVCEDDDQIRRTTRIFLEAQGYDVHTAAHPSQALELARGLSPLHLLVTDIVMTGMDGRELAERVAVLHPDAGVLFTSGYARDTRLDEAIARRRARFLEKPFTPKELLASIRGILADEASALSSGRDA